jgi:hypothetical protein
MSGITLSGKFSKALLDKNVKIWAGKGQEKLAAAMPYYKLYAKHETTMELMFSIMDGVERGSMEEIPENGKPLESTDLPGFKTTFVVKEYAQAKSISKLAGMADAAGHNQKSNARMAAYLGEAYIYALNRSVMDVIRNGFNPAYTSYGDNKPFFSTSHTRIDGGSTTYRSNASSTGIPLTYANLKVGRSAIRRVVNHAGRNIDYSHLPLVLEVPPALEDTAYEALGTEKHLYKTDAANFTPNALQANGRIVVRVNPLLGEEAEGGLGSNLAWYLHVDNLGDDEPIQVYHRQTLQVLSEKDFDTQKYKVRSDALWAVGWTDPVGKWWGSKGDSQAYAS